MFKNLLYQQVSTLGPKLNSSYRCKTLVELCETHLNLPKNYQQNRTEKVLEPSSIFIYMVRISKKVVTKVMIVMMKKSMIWDLEEVIRWPVIKSKLKMILLVLLETNSKYLEKHVKPYKSV